MIEDLRVSNNGRHGLSFNSGSQIRRCIVFGNGDVGLYNGTDKLIIRNSAQGTSVLNYDIVAGNHDAARITSPGASFASASPWANFSF